MRFSAENIEAMTGMSKESSETVFKLFKQMAEISFKAGWNAKKEHKYSSNLSEAVEEVLIQTEFEKDFVKF